MGGAQIWISAYMRGVWFSQRRQRIRRERSFDNMFTVELSIRHSRLAHVQPRRGLHDVTWYDQITISIWVSSATLELLSGSVSVSFTLELSKIAPPSSS